MEEMKSPTLDSNICRVNQLDATYLDAELLSALKIQMVRIFKYLPVDFVMRYDVEMDTFLQLSIYYFSIYRNLPSPGEALQNLKYVNPHITQRKKLYFLLFTIILPYVWKKWIRYMSENGYSIPPTTRHRKRQLIRYNLWLLCNRILIVIRVVSLAHFLIFLYNGKYRSILERYLRLRMTYDNANLPRTVVFDFMNQQLVWTAFSDFLLFMVPLINFRKISQRISQVWKAILSVPHWIRVEMRKAQKSLSSDASEIDSVMDGSGSGSGDAREMSSVVKCDLSEEEISEANKTFYNEMSTAQCTICGLRPITLPCRSNCGHLFCYYCLRGSLLAEDGRIRCPVCYELITKHTTVKHPNRKYYLNVAPPPQF